MGQGQAGATAVARLLVVDDDTAYREFIQLTLEHDGYEVRTTGDAAGALREVAAFRPDLAILDVHLGDDSADGFVIGRRLRAELDVPILFLSAFGDPARKLAGFDAGGDDYVVKGAPMPELRARIRALLRRAGKLTATTWRVGDLVLDEAGRTVHVDGDDITLTKLEFDVLRALARQHGRVVSKHALLTQVWGFDAYDPNVVEVHVSALRRKLGSVGKRYVQTVRGVGYVLRTPA